jgi:hypothetical protein
MLAYIRDRVSDRKFRLFACACCRRAWSALRPFLLLSIVDVNERFADGSADREELGNVRRCARYEFQVTAEFVRLTAAGAVWRAVWEDAAAGAPKVAGAMQRVQSMRWEWNWKRPPVKKADEARAQCDLLRDIFGNPFRPVMPSGTWMTPDVAPLAWAAYDERVLPEGRLDAARLAVLADALEEAGAPADVVTHLRGPGPHVRGCFAVDLCLGLS